MTSRQEKNWCELAANLATAETPERLRLHNDWHLSRLRIMETVGLAFGELETA
jgi:hypothetical protein